MKAATSDEIYLHLKCCNNNFIPHLEETVNIKAYSKKIYEKAVTFEAWGNNLLLALVAAYLNDKNKQTGYITNVSILKEYMGIGITSRLMRSVIDYSRQQCFKEIKLEVNRNNCAAINLYKKFGFNIVEGKDNNLIMVFDLTKNLVK
jgi:ribosomal protein S18 acetylase RimI-like enzyme